MLIFLILVSLIFFICVFLFVFYVFKIHDFIVPSLALNTLKKYKKVFIVFPHADDEVLSCGGLIGYLNKLGSHVSMVILTKGEKGTPDARLQQSLKEIRTQEALKAAHILGATSVIQKDFGDGELVNKKTELTTYLNDLLSIEKPDLIVTYDLAGMYGHPDHIALAEVVTAVIKSKFKSIELWYSAMPKNLVSTLKLPEHMSTSDVFKNNRSAPTLRLFTVPYLLAKLRTIYAYKSQRDSFKSLMPLKTLPRLIFYSVAVYEYFHKVN